MFVSGMLADRSDLRLLLCASMTFTSLIALAFGPVLQWMGAAQTSKSVYVTLMVMSGLAQSVGWPCVVAVMGNWFGRGSRGLVLGLWSSCQPTGNILAAVVGTAVVHYGYHYAFFVKASLLLACAVVVFFGLVPSPHELGLPIADEESAIKVRDIVSME
jgi:OPA family glycerol-3-phosphate transporter-like MFS transporter 3